MPFSVYTLQVITKNDLEDTKRLIGDLMKLVSKWCKPGMHAKRNIGFVIVTDETLPELAKRLWPELERLIDLGRVERFFLQPAPELIITEFGDLDPFMHWIRTGRVEARKRNNPKHMRNRKRGKRRV